MSKRIGERTIKFLKPVKFAAGYAIVGPKEAKSPAHKYFDYILNYDTFNEKTYEMAERKMLEHAVMGAVSKANLITTDIDLFVGGDLLNQITSSSYSARQLQTSFIGLYGACSTMTEALALGACLIDSGGFKNIACATCSHFSTAERQYRFPLELGNQRPPTAQWTVTGAGCSILRGEGRGHDITHIVFGRVIDFGVNDVDNMGAAMAPAAADTLCTLFKDTNTKPDDYDLIISGDLGKFGSEMLIDIMDSRGYKLKENYCDSGQMIYSTGSKAFMGGSGCGCSAAVFNTYVYAKLNDGSYKKAILMSTGALMSTTTAQQGETIPAIAHAVIIERGKD